MILSKKLKLIIFYQIIAGFKASYNQDYNQNCYAIVIKPVIDIFGELDNDLRFYKKIPLSSVDKNHKLSCPRLHQLLFNDIVKIIKKDNNNYIIQLSDIFFQTKLDNKKFNKFKTFKKNLLILDKINTQDRMKIPEKFESTIILKEPFKDNITKKTYSAGTCFVYFKKDQKDYFVYILNPVKKDFFKINIPRKICINKNKARTKQQKINLFISILKDWANNKNGFIPYVWGGCSFDILYNQDDFIKKTSKLNNKSIEYFDNPNYKNNPKTGFDCSGLIVKAAQISGLPFYYKNSFTIQNNLEPIKENEKIENGDLIWIPGHVMIISDVDKNLLIEASDYSNGYGKVQEIPLNQSFKNIQSYNDLINAYLKKQNLERQNKSGEITQIISNFKILKLNSLWSANKNNIQNQK